MSEGQAETSGVMQTPTGGPSLSHLPWSMIPLFKPGDTDINDYAKKLEFLAGLWPPEHLSHLAPRAAMLCEGSAFKRVMRLDPAKLKVNTVDGVKLLVTTLGGIWGKSKLEDKFERFERAIFSTAQRADETHESYLARHDFQFEELLQMGVGFDEVRAYVLLRNSNLGSEDKKKLMVDAQGALEYTKIVSSLKLLGSKFFHELQTGNRTSARNKTYDVNAVFEDENPAFPAEDETAYLGESYEDAEIIYDEGDPDAVVCMQFEESLVDALQADPDIAACYNSYLDARKRLTDRNKNRGFWGTSKGSYPPGKGKGKGKNKGFQKGRKPLAQRILESECRRCGARGHWKAECPLNRATGATNASGTSKDGAFAGTIMTALAHDDPDVDMIPINASADVPYQQHNNLMGYEVCNMGVGVAGVNNQGMTPCRLSRLLNSLKARLCPQLKSPPESQPMSSVASTDAEAMFVSHGPCGIVDLGASQTVIGKQQMQDLMTHVPKSVQKQIQRVPCHTVFRFGNSSTVTCHEAVLIPLSQWMVKVCVVDSQTPFLISNNVFRTLGAQIDTAQDEVRFAKLGFSMKLLLSEKKLYLLDFCELLRLSHVHSHPVSDPKAIMHMCETEHAPHGSTSQSQVAQSSQPSVPSSECPDVSTVLSTDVVQEPGRPFCRRDGAESSGRLHEDVLCRASRTPNHVRGSQGEPALHRRSSAGSQIRQVVHPEVPEEREAGPQDIPVLHPALRGTSGTDSGKDHQDASPESPKTTAPHAKSKSAPRPAQNTAWSDEELSDSWSVDDQVTQQGHRLNAMESTLSQIAQQVQMLTQAIMAKNHQEN